MGIFYIIPYPYLFCNENVESGQYKPARPLFGLLQTLLVSLDHLLDHLAADGAGLTGGQVTVVTVGQIDAHLPWCPFYILNSPDKEVPTGC